MRQSLFSAVDMSAQKLDVFRNSKEAESRRFSVVRNFIYMYAVGRSIACIVSEEATGSATKTTGERASRAPLSAKNNRKSQIESNIADCWRLCVRSLSRAKAQIK